MADAKAGRRETGQRRRHQGPAHDAVDRGRYGRDHPAGRLQRRQGRVSGQQLEKDGPQRVHVRRGRGRSPLGQLRGEIQPGRATGWSSPLGEDRQSGREAQVADLHPARGAEPDALGVHPAVNQGGVGMAQARRRMAQQSVGPHRIHRLALAAVRVDDVAQGVPVHPLVGDQELPALAGHTDQRREVAVWGKALRPGQVPFQHRQRRPGRDHHPERHVCPRLGIARPVQLDVTVAPEVLLDPEPVAEQRARVMPASRAPVGAGPERRGFAHPTRPIVAAFRRGWRSKIIGRGVTMS
jgi:hypothetical protein